MSPEQASGQGQVDARTDQYSLGASLYEMLTGEPPFRGTPAMIVHQVLEDEPRPPRQLSEAIPRDLETICLEDARQGPLAALSIRRPSRGRPQALAAWRTDRCTAGGPVRPARPLGPQKPPCRLPGHDDIPPLEPHSRPVPWSLRRSSIVSAGPPFPSALAPTVARKTPASQPRSPRTEPRLLWNNEPSRSTLSAR